MKYFKFIIRLMYVIFSMLMFPIVCFVEWFIAKIIYKNNQHKKIIKQMYFEQFFVLERADRTVVVYKNAWNYLIQKIEYDGKKVKNLTKDEYKK